MKASKHVGQFIDLHIVCNFIPMQLEFVRHGIVVVVVFIIENIVDDAPPSLLEALKYHLQSTTALVVHV